jgi:hypothetical protein
VSQLVPIGSPAIEAASVEMAIVDPVELIQADPAEMVENSAP